MIIKQAQLNEDYNTPSVSDVARFLKRSVHTLLHSEYAICKFGLRHPSLDFMVGWSDGYDINDESILHDSISPSFGINAGIKVHTSDMGPDFDFYNFPYENNGDVWDTSCGIAPNEDYESVAKYLINEYNKLKDLDIDWDGKILRDTNKEADAEIEEAYIDTEDDSIKSYKYKDQTVYRIIATRMEGDRTQMFTIGTGTKLDDTEFEPVVRSARYTTEESFLWLDSVKAEKFLRRFKREYPEVDMSKMHVAEYNPLYPIVKLVPISSPCGRAYLGVQDIPKEKLADKKEDEKKTESVEKANLSEGIEPQGIIAQDIYNAILEYNEDKYKDMLDMNAVNTFSAKLEKVLNANGGIAGHNAEAHVQVSGKRYTVRVFIKLTAKENNQPFKVILNGACIFDDAKNPNINDKVTDYEWAVLGKETQKYIIFGPWDGVEQFNPDPFIDKSHGPTIYDSFDAFNIGGAFDRDFKIQVLHHPYFLERTLVKEIKNAIANAIDTKASEDVTDGIDPVEFDDFVDFYKSCKAEIAKQYELTPDEITIDAEDAYTTYLRRYQYWNF